MPSNNNVARCMAATIAATVLGAALYQTVYAKRTSAMSKSLVLVTPADLAGGHEDPVTDDANMKVIAGAGAHVRSVAPFASVDRAFRVDVSEYDQITLELKDWPVDEFMYFIEGRVEITDSGGHSKVFGPGDSFVMPRGFSGTWKQLSRIKKIAVMYSGGSGSFQ